MLLRLAFGGYLTVLVALPILAVVWRGLAEGPAAFAEAVTTPTALAALKLSLGTAGAVALSMLALAHGSVAADSRVVPSGTVIPVRFETAVSTASASAGDLVVARVREDVLVRGRVAIPEGLEATEDARDVDAVERVLPADVVQETGLRGVLSDADCTPFDSTVRSVAEMPSRH